MPEGHAGLRGGLLKRVEIHHHHVDGLDAMSGHSRLVLRVPANVEQPAVHARVQRLHAPVQHLRKSRQLADVLDRKPASRSAFAVPPVETSSTPKPASARANSTRPVLSVTLSSARRIGFAPVPLAFPSELTLPLLV